MPVALDWKCLALLCALTPAAAPCAQAQAQSSEFGANPALAAPFEETTATANLPRIVPWPENAMPRVIPGFRVRVFADKLESPRGLLVLPNGDVLTSEAADKRGLQVSSPDRITLLRDEDKDGFAETRHLFLKNLNQPFGMALIGNILYVASTDGVWRYPYYVGQTRMQSAGEKILDLPPGPPQGRWMRNLAVSPDEKRLFVSVPSFSDAGESGLEKEARRAVILSIRPDGADERVYASGIRYPVGMAFQPETNDLWAVSGERDETDGHMIPDYLAKIYKGGFYGWPFSYFGTNPDPRWAEADPARVAQAIRPDFSLGAHTAAMGFSFCETDRFPGRYRNGAFIALHGSVYRSNFAGYKVVFLPFENGAPTGKIESFLTGFMADRAAGTAYGRPVSTAFTMDGRLLVSDDAGKTIWSIEPEAALPKNKSRSRQEMYEFN